MPIVDWQDDRSKEAAASIRYSDDALLHVIKMSEDRIVNRWRGVLKLTRNPSEQRGVRQLNKTVLVKLSNNLSGCDVNIKIYDQVSRRRNDNGNRLVHMSMNGSLHMSEESLAEMNLAIEEAIAVYRHPAHWIELNAKN